MADDSVQRPSERRVVVGRHHHREHVGSRAVAAQNSSSSSHHPLVARQCLTWSRMVVAGNAPSPPPRSGAASVVVKGKLFIFGGYGGGTGRLDDFWSFDFETNVWEEVPVWSNVKPGSRENNGVVISDSSRSIYLFGGYNGRCLCVV